MAAAVQSSAVLPSIPAEPNRKWGQLPGNFVAMLVSLLGNRSTVSLLQSCKTCRDLILHHADNPCLSIQLPSTRRAKDADKPTSKEAMTMFRSQVTLGRAALTCKSHLELRLMPGAPGPRNRVGFWTGHPDRKTPDFPSDTVTDQMRDVLSGATYFVNAQLTSITALSLQGARFVGLVPGILAAALPNLASLRLASCSLVTDVPVDPLRALRPHCRRLSTLRLEHPEFVTRGANKNKNPLLDLEEATLQEPKPFGSAPRTVLPRNRALIVPSFDEIVRAHDRLLSELSCITCLELWLDPSFQGGEWATLVLVPAFGEQLQRLTLGTVGANTRLASYCVPTIKTWGKRLSALTHIDIGATGWVIDNKAADMLARLSPTLTHVTVMGFGLHSVVKADWTHVTIACREYEVHVPSLGRLELPNLQQPITIRPPVTTPSPATGTASMPRLLRLGFSNLKPGGNGDDTKEDILETIENAKKTGCVFQGGASGLFVTVESNHTAVWDATLALVGPNVTAIHLDRGTFLDEPFLEVLSTHVGTCLTHLVMVEPKDLRESVWGQITNRLPELNKLTFQEEADQMNSSTPVQQLVSSLNKPLSMTIKTASKSWVVAGLAGLPEAQRKLFTGNYVAGH